MGKVWGENPNLLNCLTNQTYGQYLLFRGNSDEKYDYCSLQGKDSTLTKRGLVFSKWSKRQGLTCQNSSGRSKLSHVSAVPCRSGWTRQGGLKLVQNTGQFMGHFMEIQMYRGKTFNAYIKLIFLSGKAAWDFINGAADERLYINNT